MLPVLHFILHSNIEVLLKLCFKLVDYRRRHLVFIEPEMAKKKWSQWKALQQCSYGIGSFWETHYSLGYVNTSNNEGHTEVWFCLQYIGEQSTGTCALYICNLAPLHTSCITFKVIYINYKDREYRTYFLTVLLWIQIYWIWIRIQDFGPIWIRVRIQGYSINFEIKK